MGYSYWWSWPGRICLVALKHDVQKIPFTWTSDIIFKKYSTLANRNSQMMGLRPLNKRQGIAAPAYSTGQLVGLFRNYDFENHFVI
jgi:hypothetical protein